MTQFGQIADSDPHKKLQRGISHPRFQTYLTAAKNNTVLARELYVWNRDLSAAFLADIAILEVALRNAMHDAAAAVWGEHWYSRPEIHMDKRSSDQLSAAWKHLPDSVKRRANDSDVPGRLVAQCMFGFWTNLLDSGGFIGESPRKFSVNYETLWRDAFKHAFPGARSEARQKRNTMITQLKSDVCLKAQIIQLQQNVAFTRSWVHSVCKNVNDLRNRAAHHEPLINGFPLNGQNRRMTPSEGYEEIRLLARMLDRQLAEWIDEYSQVPKLLRNRPSRSSTINGEGSR